MQRVFPWPVSIRALVCLSLIALALPAAAFLPVNQNAEYEIPLPFFLETQGGSFGRDMGSVQVEQHLGAMYGGNWHVQSWNSRSSSPHYVYGKGAQLAAMVTDEAHAEQLALQVIAANGEIFRGPMDQLQFKTVHHGKGKWVAHFQQYHDGLEVWQARSLVAFSDEGRVILMGSDSYGDIDINSIPSMSVELAEIIAKGALPFDPATDSIDGESTLMILPVPMSVDRVEHHLVWRVRVHTENPLGTWVTHLDAHDGEILWRYNDIHFAFGGDARSDVEPSTWCNGLHDEPMPHLRVQLGVGTVNTDADGDWTHGSGNASTSVTATLYGPYGNVSNVSGANAYFSGTAYADTPFQVTFDDGNAQRDERDVFNGINDLRDFFELFAPGWYYTNGQMYGRVSLSDHCNAYWNGNINFFSEGDGCANTGQIEGVVYHEHGHGVQAAILGWQGDQGLGEGNSDICAQLQTQESIVGRGFYLSNCVSGIRNADNDLIYPDDVIGIPIHAAGQVIAGFHWRVMMSLQAQYGLDQGTVMTADNWHQARMLLHPTVQPDQVFAAFFADDDDGDLDNGTPHYGALYNAATHHGFDSPPILVGVIVLHDTPLSDTGNSDLDYVLQADVYSTDGEIVDESFVIRYRVDGGFWEESSMQPAGMGGGYVGSIPAQNPSLIEYYLYAEDNTGQSGVAPINAPTEAYRFHVAQMFEDMEDGCPEWVAGDTWDQATSGIWELVDPVGTAAQPENDHSTIGTKCWVTGQHTPGEVDDFNDVDGGTTTLFTPVWDLSEAENVSLSYWWWYSNDTGENPGADWWKVYISNNGGSSFSLLDQTNNSTEGWELETFNLSEIFETVAQVKVKFMVTDIGGDSRIEGAVDDLFLLADFDDMTDAGDLAVAFVSDLGQNYPNPFNPLTEISFTLDRNGPASLRIYAADGRLVKELMTGDQTAGSHRVVWNGTDSQNQPVASGVYLYRLVTEDKEFGRRMLLVK